MLVFRFFICGVGLEALKAVDEAPLLDQICIPNDLYAKKKNSEVLNFVVLLPVNIA